MDKLIEHRCFDGRVELRAADGEGGSSKIVGYAAVFNSESEDLGGFREKIAPGTFKRALKEGQDVRALVEHDPSRIIGRSTAGTLNMAEDKEGLRVEIDPPDTQIGRDVMESISRGDLTQMSFGFRTIKEEWDESGEEIIRTLKDVDLFDVSVVAYPAYPDTTVASRSFQVQLEAGKLRRAADPTLEGRMRLQAAKMRRVEEQSLENAEALKGLRAMA